MRQFLFFTSFILLIDSSSAQVFFNRRYDLSEGENGSSILQDSNTYVAVVGTYSSTSLVKLQLIKLDSIGNIILNKTIESPTTSYYSGGSGSLSRTIAGGFVVGGGKNDSTNSNSDDATIYLFDNLGDTLWTKTFGDTLFQTFYQCKQTSDNGFICSGETTSSDSYGNVLNLLRN